MALMSEERTRGATTVEQMVGQLVLLGVRKVAKMDTYSVKLKVHSMVGLLV
jgi:hypothetical protein